MDFSWENTELWHFVIQFGIIACGLLAANILRRKVPFINRSLAPTAVLTGFLFLILKTAGLISLDGDLLETLTYHGIAVGFIALSLRVPKSGDRGEILTSFKSGALIVSTYLFQGLIGLTVTIALAYTVMPGLFKASGILLPMGYGQGPGQANNVGVTYETLGFTGGQSFGLSLAAAGYACACIIGVVYLNVLSRKNKISVKQHEEISGSVSIDTFQDKGEIPIAESIDRFTIQVALVLAIYLLTYLFTCGITSALAAGAPGVAKTLNPLLWGFNFIVGSMLALAARSVISAFGKYRLMTHQYQNNYLLGRISGFAFDLMIIAGIATIDIKDLAGLWLPFAILAVLGGFLTLFYLQIVCKKIYPGYYYEGFLSMYGMLTGTISSGILLLREIDPDFETPAANNLITGSSYGIMLGAPLLAVIGIAPKSEPLLFVSYIIVAAYWLLLLAAIYKINIKKQKKKA